MRLRNWRIVIVGVVVALVAVGFYGYMQSIASTSNDPVALMKTVGQVAGAVIGLCVVMIIVGLIGRKA